MSVLTCSSVAARLRANRGNGDVYLSVCPSVKRLLSRNMKEPTTHVGSLAYPIKDQLFLCSSLLHNFHITFWPKVIQQFEKTSTLTNFHAVFQPFFGANLKTFT